MQTGTFRGFDVEVRDPGIALITFNRPEKLNGLDQWIKRDLVETLTQAQMDDQVRVIVFRLGAWVLRWRRHLGPRPG